MVNKKFQKLAKKIAKREKATFDALLEFEKTGKTRTKKRLNFTVDSTIALQFRRFCRKNGYNMSAKIEQAMEKIINS